MTTKLTAPQRRALSLMMDGYYLLFDCGLLEQGWQGHTMKIHHSVVRALINKGFVYYVARPDIHSISQKGWRALIDDIRQRHPGAIICDVCGGIIKRKVRFRLDGLRLCEKCNKLSARERNEKRGVWCDDTEAWGGRRPTR